jgi:putative N6-adenine-specific DNA methylase
MNGVFGESHKDAGGREQKIFVRVLKDDFTVSIDSSGELLHKRGVKKQGGRAPIRETIAAAALNLAGYNVMEPLVDPMCGSGTFTIEAAMRANNIPPGWYRDFAFMDWPCFRQKRWDYIKKTARKEFSAVTVPTIFASDKDQKAVSAFRKQIRGYPFSKSIAVQQKDFFDLSPADFDLFGEVKQPGMVAINPPYGLRLGKRPESRKLFQDIGRKLVLDFKGWKLILVAPHKSLLKNTPFRFTAAPFFHGGLNLTLLTGRIL